MNSGEISTSLATVTIGTTIYTSFMPSFSKVLNAEPTQPNVKQVRDAEMFSGAMVLAIGAILGYIVKSKVPAAIAITVVVAMTVVYEAALRKVT